MTRQRDIEFSAEVGRALPVLHEALAHVGHRQTRNRGTIGGSLCHLDPSAELVNVAALLDGDAARRARSAARRDIPFAEFAVGLHDDESSRRTSCSPASRLPLPPQRRRPCVRRVRAAPRRLRDRRVFRAARARCAAARIARCAASRSRAWARVPCGLPQSSSALRRRAAGRRALQGGGGRSGQARRDGRPVRDGGVSQASRARAHLSARWRRAAAARARRERRWLTRRTIAVTVNGAAYEREVETRTDARRLPAPRARTSPARTSAASTACAARARCSSDGASARACLMLAVQCDGEEVATVECSRTDGELNRAPAGVSGPSRPAVRVLHAGHADDADRVPARPSRSDRKRRCARRCPAISAAAPAIRAWSMRRSLRRSACGRRVSDRSMTHRLRRLRPAQGGSAAPPRRRAATSTTSTLPGMLHAAFVRSPHAHARVGRIDKSRGARGSRRARGSHFADLPETVRAADAAAARAAPGDQAAVHAVRAREGRGLLRRRAGGVRDRRQPLHRGGRRAAGGSRIRAAARGERLPRGARSRTRRSRTRAAESNVAARFPVQGRATPTARSPARRTCFARRIYQHRGGPFFIECRGVVASYETQSRRRCTLYVSSQGSHRIKRCMLDMFDLGDHQVRVVTPDVGGGFGPKGSFYPEYVNVAVAAHAARAAGEMDRGPAREFPRHAPGARPVLGHGDRGRRRREDPRRARTARSTKPAPTCRGASCCRGSRRRRCRGLT